MVSIKPGARHRPDDLAAGVEPMAEVPGGPQVDVPAAQGHRPASDDER